MHKGSIHDKDLLISQNLTKESQNFVLQIHTCMLLYGLLNCTFLNVIPLNCIKYKIRNEIL